MKTLIVEDNRTSGKLLKAVLEAEGFETMMAEDGRVALDILTRTAVDCIVSDVMMPNVDGYRLVYKVRQIEKLKNIPFIMYSAVSATEDEEEFAFTLGVDRYIRKPGGIRDIVDAIRESMTKKRLANQEPNDSHRSTQRKVIEKYGKLLIDKLEEKIGELERTTVELESSEARLRKANEALAEKTTMLSVDHAKIRDLNRSLEAFQHAVNHSSILSRTDIHGNITYVNQKFLDISGYSAAELIGHSHHVVSSGHHPPEFWKELWNTILSGRTWRGEVKNRNKDGSYTWLDAFVIPVTDEAGNIIEFLSIRNDITKRKWAEERLEQTVAELTESRTLLEQKVEERTRDLHEALKKEKELVNMKSQFIAIVSHEFKTPLATISFLTGMVKKFRDRLSDNEVDERLEGIEKNVSFMTTLLDDVLLLARADAGRLTANISPVDGKDLFNRIVHQVLDSCKHSHPITSYVHIAEKVLHTDEMLLRNILSNLLSNAIKYSPRGKPVILVAEEQGQQLVIEVKDAGSGISEEEQKTIFEAFTRGRDVANVEGSGLGLSIVRKSLEALNGTIEVKSKINEGSIFTVRIPMQHYA